MNQLDQFLTRAEALLARLEAHAAAAAGARRTGSAAIAFRWRKRATATATLQPVRHVARSRSPTCSNRPAEGDRSSRTRGSSCRASRPTTCC